jgi:hypothetical protein
MDESVRIRRTYWMRYPVQQSYASLRIGGLPERLRFSGCALVRRSTASELARQPQRMAEGRQFVLRLTLFVPGLCSGTGFPVAHRLC